MTGYNLPPGCSVRDLPGWDDCELPLYHCEGCGAFLPQLPDWTVGVTVIKWCDGKPQHYYDEYMGKRMKIDFPAPCGCKEANHFGQESEWFNSDPKEYEHAPHWFAHPFDNMCDTHVRVCRKCFYENKWAEL